MTLPPALDARPILEALNRHNVAYVLIGGYAAIQHGATRSTQDIDVTPSTELENLGRLTAALKEWAPVSGSTTCPRACRSIPRPRRCAG